jgi:hypothetical protein
LGDKGWFKKGKFKESVVEEKEDWRKGFSKERKVRRRNVRGKDERKSNKEVKNSTYNEMVL